MDAVHTMRESPPRSRRRLRWFVLGGVVVLGVSAWVAFGWFGVHLLFVDEKVSEPVPVFAGAPADTEDTEEQSSLPGTFEGTFEGVDHGASGTAVVLEADGRRVLRFEPDFSTSNGPDLFVYLGTGSGDYRNAEEYVELGSLKGNEGSQNYEIPAEVDLDRFTTVAVWCKRFDSTFAVAVLSAT